MRVGKEVQRQVLAEELKKKKKVQTVDMTDEERKAMTDALMTLPKDRQIPALRSAGLSEEADRLEQQRAEEHLMELRQEKLDRINALPVEQRLTELITGGFKDEALALSEQLAIEKEAEEKTENAVEEPKTETRKKGGRPRKSKK